MKQTYLHKYFFSMLLLICGAHMLQAQQVTDTLRYSGQIVRWTVPAGVTSVTIQTKGAEGGQGRSFNANAGLGASLQGTFSVVPGKVLKILVGQKPNSRDFGGDGGGGSFVTDTFNNPLIIAGGGGGSGRVDAASKHGQAGASGGNGGGLRDFGAGGTGGNGGGAGFAYAGGGGGLSTNGMTGNPNGTGGQAFVNGGAGGLSGNDRGGFGGGGAGDAFGAGGGGGYSGGGSAGYSGDLSNFGVGGGGGSINTGTNQTNTGGVNSGDGLVTITYVTPSITCGRDTLVYSTANQCGAVVNYTAPAIPPGFTRSVSDTFRFTGARQNFTVPAGVSAVTIKAWGAQGGANIRCTTNTALGGYVQGNLAVATNDILHVYVGEQPATIPYNNFINPGGYNGGGSHGAYSGGGGGASDVRRGDTSIASRVIVAGGGGGNNSDCNSGGAGGGLQGVSGEANVNPQYFGGGGGTQTTGGIAGYEGQNGSIYQGGSLQDQQPGGVTVYTAGGGGGYYGGGGAVFAGAGGGSSYIGGVTNGSTQAGVNSGNGMVVISYDAPVTYTLTQTAGIPSGSTFPVGTTVNTYVLSLDGTPLDTCSFVVTVGDTIKPTITAPAAVTVNTNPGVCSAGNVALGIPTASDNCSGVMVINNAPATFPKGTTTVTYTARDSSGNTATATQMVTVVDNEKPVITCPAAQQFCYSSTGNYTIPALQATDNCGIQSITYSITGATQRSGTGNNASGTFNAGTSTITWTVRDASNNMSTCSTTVKVNSQILVTIADSKALNSNGVAVNTVYIGYSPASSITLTANASGGSGTYTYQWSNGATTKSITVSPAATTPYTVTVKDGSNCSSMVNKTINVVDVRCGNKLDKVSVCHNGNTLCISDNAVPAHLSHTGDMLGTCGSSAIASRTTTSSAINSIEETAVAAPLATIVYPNPNKGQFSVRLNTTNATKADVQVLNAQGVIISRKTVQVGGKSQTVSFSLHNPAAGTYLVKIMSEEVVQVLKMIVQP